MIYRFEFVKGTDMAEVEDTVGLSIIACESLIGHAATRLDASYATSYDKRSVVVRGRNQAECFPRIFCGFCAAEYGRDGFKVECVDDKPAAASGGPAPVPE